MDNAFNHEQFDAQIYPGESHFGTTPAMEWLRLCFIDSFENKRITDYNGSNEQRILCMGLQLLHHFLPLSLCNLHREWELAVGLRTSFILLPLSSTTVTVLKNSYEIQSKLQQEHSNFEIHHFFQFQTLFFGHWRAIYKQGNDCLTSHWDSSNDI